MIANTKTEFNPLVTIDYHKDLLNEYLSDNSLKYSSKRETVLDTVKTLKGQFTVFELSQTLLDKGVSQKSTYVHLNTLIKANIVKRVAIDTGALLPSFKFELIE